MPVYEITDPQSGRTIEIEGDSPPSEEELQQIFSTISQPAQEVSGPTDSSAIDTLGNAALEVISGVNRGALSVADIPSDIVNAVSQIAGSDFRAPTFRGTELGRQATTGGFIEDPTARQILGTVGEFAAPGIPVGMFAKSRGAQTSGASALQAQGDDVARELIQTPASPNVATKVLAQGGKAVDSPVLKEAQKQGITDKAIAIIKTAPEADKEVMRNMLEIMKSGRTDALKEAKIRPASAAGKSLVDRVDHLKKVNSQAGKAIQKESEKLKGVQADLSGPIDTFGSKMDEFGVSIIPDGKGGKKADFKDTNLAPGDRGPIKEVVRQMSRLSKGNAEPDALDAHQLKRIIDRNVTFGKSKSGLSEDAERALKEFRTGLNESLRNASKEYREANTEYSETLDALDSLQKSAGTNVDFFGPRADEALGTSLRRLLGNPIARVNMMNAIDEAEAIGRKYGGDFKGDITRQMLFADELDSLFGTTARASIKGQMQQVSDKAARDAQSAVMATQGAPDTGLMSRIIGGSVAKARGINEENAIKAIEEMLK